MAGPFVDYSCSARLRKGTIKKRCQVPFVVTFWYYVCMDKKVLRGLALKKEENDKVVKRIITFSSRKETKKLVLLPHRRCSIFFLRRLGLLFTTKGWTMRSLL